MNKLSEYAIVYVDDEAMSLKYFEKEFSKDFNVFTATSAADGWELIQKHPGQVGVLMSDQRMPGQTGVQLLEKVRHHFPQIIRILVTAYSDIDSAIAGINDSAIFRYINKPWEVSDLRITLLRALEFYGVLMERDHLLREKLSVLQQIVLCDRTKNLGVVAAGLASCFRNAVSAALAFVADIPEPPRLAADGPPTRLALGRNFESELHRASQDVFHVADTMKKLAENRSGFSAEPLSLESLLSPAARIELSNPQGSVSLKIASGIPKIKADRNQIERLLTLLVSAVSKANDGGTSIAVEATESRQDSGRTLVKIQITDDGPDWTANQHHRFFAPFATTDSGDRASGMDLAICYFIVHHHSGRISVPGQAKSRVVIELPTDPLASDVEALQSDQLVGLFRRDFALT